MKCPNCGQARVTGFTLTGYVPELLMETVGIRCNACEWKLTMADVLKSEPGKVDAEDE